MHIDYDLTGDPILQPFRNRTLNIDVRLQHPFRMTCAHDENDIGSRTQQHGNVQMFPQDLSETNQLRELT
ncbi:hypothetical protein PG989_013666 [Apiospora arundinis]